MIGGNPYVLRSVTRTLPPKRESRGIGRAIRTVDLGDVTEMSYDAKREISGVIDDPSKYFRYENFISLLAKVWCVFLGILSGE